MKPQYSIFSLKPVLFEQGERDPFGFDDFAEKLGETYLPFSGTVRKPSYFLFITYIDKILSNHFRVQNKKERDIFRVRLEKLLVYCWKKNSNGNLRGDSIIGNSYSLKEIEPFTDKRWVRQNCFKIYTDKIKKIVPNTFEFYFRLIGEKQIDILYEFLTNEKDIMDQEKYLGGIVKKLSKKNSLFSNHLLSHRVKEKFKNEFLKTLKEHNSSHKEYIKVIELLEKQNKLNIKNFYHQTLDNPKLPFFLLNQWFGAFIAAVNADIENSSKSKFLWKKADEFFDGLQVSGLDSITVKGEKIHLDKRQKPRIWVNVQKDGKYLIIEDASKLDRQLWTSYKNRVGVEGGSKYFFNFRHFAFSKLLKELDI